MNCDFADGISDVGSWEEGDRSALLLMASCLCHSVTSGSSCLTPDYLEVVTKCDLLSMESWFPNVLLLFGDCGTPPPMPWATAATVLIGTRLLNEAGAPIADSLSRVEGVGSPPVPSFEGNYKAYVV